MSQGSPYANDIQLSSRYEAKRGSDYEEYLSYG